MCLSLYCNQILEPILLPLTNAGIQRQLGDENSQIPINLYWGDIGITGIEQPWRQNETNDPIAEYAEFKRNLFRMQIAKNEISTCAISGPVGTYSSIDPRIEEHVAKKFGLMIEPVSTQIIPRDRHAAYFTTLAIIASSIERLATEIRNLQRT